MLGLLHAFNDPNISYGTVAECPKRFLIDRAIVRCNGIL